MALDKAIQTPSGLEATYHRIVGSEMSFVPDPYVPGCIGSVYVHVASYASQEAREANAVPMASQTVRIRFGPKVVGEFKGKPVLAIQSEEPTRAEIYEALVRTPTFRGAGEA